MQGSPTLAPQGGVIGKGKSKGITKLGNYLGGLDPLVVKPTPGVGPNQMASTIFRRPGSPTGRS